MSPIFGYVMLFLFWASLAALIWLVAAVLLLRRHTRRIGRCLFLAMAGTFPGVLLYQLAAAPVVIAVLGLAGIFWRIVEPGATGQTSNPVVEAVSMVAALFVICFAILMSIIGFYEGWRIGWACGSGRPLRSLVESTAPVRWSRWLLARMRGRT
jgi:hypothetical protein